MNYMLTERAANALRKLLRDANAVVPAPHQSPRKTRPDFASMAKSSDGSKFLFRIKFGVDEVSEEKKVTISEGAVQIGGYTYFVEEQQLVGLYESFYLCLFVDLSSSEATIEQIEDEDAMKAAQDDMGKFVIPLYKIVDGEVAVDYRPMPFLGIWEDQPNES